MSAIERLRRLKLVDTAPPDSRLSWGRRLLWLMLIWCTSVGALGVIAYALRLVLMR